MSQPKNTTVGVRMTKTRRAELKETVEANPEYNSVPDLLRTAAVHEQSDDYGLLAGQSGSSTEPEAVGELHTTVNELKSDVKQIKRKVDEIPREIRYDRERSEKEVRNRLMKALQKGERNAVGVSQLSEMIEEDIPRISNHLDYLRNQTGIVAKTEDNRWYRSEEG
jgi:DNA-binding transcriptional ArsR family regulator